MVACHEDPKPQPGVVITPSGFAVPSRETALQQDYELRDAFPNVHFDSPVSMIQAGDHMLIAERTGRIFAFERRDDVTEKHLVLDLSAHAIAQKDSGLLAIAAHPDFAKEGAAGKGQLFAFYAYVTEVPEGDTGNVFSHVLRLSRFTVGDDWTADPSSEQVLVAQPDKHLWHQGGGLFFHPKDGFLYLTIGDEGGYDCHYETCQHNDVLFGAVLRLDVDCRGGEISHPIVQQPSDATTDHYCIPNDNPFVGQDDVMEEVYALGLRNPFRMTYDPVDDQVWIGDVGEHLHDEVDILGKAANFQWDIMEGAEARPNPSDPSRPRPGVWTDPLISYGRSDMKAIIGGYVYRGSELRGLYGKYVHADYRSGTVWATEYAVQGGRVSLVGNEPILESEYADDEDGISSFAVDNDGTLYVLTIRQDAPVLALRVAANQAPPAPRLLSQTKLFSDLKELTPSKKLREYTINTPLWSDGSGKRRFLGLPGAPAGYTEQGAWELPQGTVLVKHFELPLDEHQPDKLHRLETRVLVIDDHGVYGATYKWRDDQSDAELSLDHVEQELSITQIDGSVRKQTHIFPSSGECLRCHDPAAGKALGIQTAQLNLELDGHSQLEALAEEGLLEGLPADLGSLPHLAPLSDTEAPIEQRVRSYLHANCSFCHGSRELAGAQWDARITTELADAQILDGEVLGLEGQDDLRIVAPGDPERSYMLQRVASTDRNQRMPPLASARPDSTFVGVLAEWIRSLESDEDNNGFGGEGDIDIDPTAE
ncbi:MAG: PQQ-dependent sugar dehydrogenase [Myxococcales bacterium]